jgi:2-oxo-4-hydroxy-4-carboxy--5-ureidoimidazoline (OHCU) decarboxylase
VPEPVELDAADASAARDALAPLFEGAPRFLDRLIAARPFGTWPALFERARDIAHAMPEAEQVELIDAHPRLGAPREVVSALSAREQGYHHVPVEAAFAAPPELARLNDAYEARFGFRYCVFVAGRPLAALVPELEAALARDRDSELHRALDAVVDIAAARHAAATREAAAAAREAAGSAGGPR